MAEIRDEVVTELLSASQAAQRALDEAINVYAPTTDEMRAAAALLQDSAVDHLTEAGAIKPAPSVFALKRRQITALAAVGQVLDRWWRHDDTRQTLGDVVKTLPAGDAHAIGWALHWGGFIPADEVPPEPPEPCDG